MPSGRLRRGPVVVVSLLAGALALAGCANEVGPSGRTVGGPCRDMFDCGSGSFCAEGTPFPEGTCVRNCRSDPTDCPGGSACVDQRGGLCLLTCTSDDGCRPGYRCQAILARPSGSTARVCLGGI